MRNLQRSVRTSKKEYVAYLDVFTTNQPFLETLVISIVEA